MADAAAVGPIITPGIVRTVATIILTVLAEISKDAEVAEGSVDIFLAVAAAVHAGGAVVNVLSVTFIAAVLTVAPEEAISALATSGSTPVPVAGAVSVQAFVAGAVLRADSTSVLAVVSEVIACTTTALTAVPVRLTGTVSADSGVTVPVTFASSAGIRAGNPVVAGVAVVALGTPDVGNRARTGPRQAFRASSPDLADRTLVLALTSVVSFIAITARVPGPPGITRTIAEVPVVTSPVRVTQRAIRARHAVPPVGTGITAPPHVPREAGAVALEPCVTGAAAVHLANVA